MRFYKKNNLFIALLLCIISCILTGCTMCIDKDIIEKYISKVVEENDKEKIESAQQLSLQSADLLRVVDGDTLYCILDGQEVYVRLIGIDTAESVNPNDEKNNQFGEMASEYTKEIVSNYDTIYLEIDQEMYDHYDRVLAYVWLEPNVSMQSSEDIASLMLNYILLNEGYAYDLPISPNLKYAEIFETVCTNAQNSNAGLWAYKEYDELYLLNQ